MPAIVCAPSKRTTPSTEAGMHDSTSDQHNAPQAKGLLRPGRFLWARALPWGVVLGIALWFAYKFSKGVGIGLGLGGTGLPTTLGVLAALAFYVLNVRLVEWRTPDELGVERLAPDLAMGVALGAAFFSVVIAVLLATGAYTLTGPTAAAAWLPLADSLEGTVEELIFRGSIFRLLSGVFGIWWALGLSSASFGAWHLVKPGVEMMAVLGVICAGGIPLAALYMLTGRLWASIGYHVAWNFTEAFVFGAHVSGSDLGPSLYHVRPAAGVDTLWTGGEFGPEASIATVVLGLMVGAALLVLAKRRS
jgi:membrane protease YdiL (CAAX protease family)